jgi:FtsP/CotA-like multicopper oxidase with cupredoxin domain
LKRRDFLKIGGAALAQANAASLLAQAPMQMGVTAPAETTKADYTLRIAPVTVELSPDHILSTTGYNDSSPGPVLRMREGKTVSVDVINDTDVPELVHWHGMLIPSEVDGVEERCLRVAGAAISSRRVRPARVGITRTPWPKPTSIAEAIPDNSVSST